MRRAILVEFSSHSRAALSNRHLRIEDALVECGLDLRGCQLQWSEDVSAAGGYSDAYLCLVIDPWGVNEWLPACTPDGRIGVRVDLDGLKRRYARWLNPEGVS